VGLRKKKKKKKILPIITEIGVSAPRQKVFFKSRLRNVANPSIQGSIGALTEGKYIDIVHFMLEKRQMLATITGSCCFVLMPCYHACASSVQPFGKPEARSVLHVNIYDH